MPGERVIFEAGKTYLDSQGRKYKLMPSGPDFWQDGKGRLWWRKTGKSHNRSPEWDLISEAPDGQ